MDRREHPDPVAHLSGPSPVAAPARGAALPGREGRAPRRGLRLVVRGSAWLLGLGSVAAVTVAVCLVMWTVVPLAAGWRPTVVLTGSMAPSVVPGDVVLSAPVEPGDVAPGRVLLVHDPSREGRLLLHRAVSVGTDGSVVTRGDANPSADPAPVPATDVVALPRLRVPAVGLPVVWLGEGRWAPLLLTVVVAGATVHLATRAVFPQVGARARRRGPS